MTPDTKGTPELDKEALHRTPRHCSFQVGLATAAERRYDGGRPHQTEANNGGFNALNMGTLSAVSSTSVFAPSLRPIILSTFVS